VLLEAVENTELLVTEPFPKDEFRAALAMALSLRASSSKAAIGDGPNVDGLALVWIEARDEYVLLLTRMLVAWRLKKSKRLIFFLGCGFSFILVISLIMIASFSFDSAAGRAGEYVGPSRVVNKLADVTE
jgi:hypothetical protein